MTRDRITGLISIILGGMAAVYAFFLPPSGTEGDVGPALFPYIAAALLVLCGLALAVKKSGQAPPFFSAPEQVRRFLFITLVYIIYGILLWAAGFLIATQLACFLLCRMMAERGPETAWWKHALFSLMVTGIVYYFFYVTLNLKLPVGRIIRFRL